MSGPTGVGGLVSPEPDVWFHGSQTSGPSRAECLDLLKPDIWPTGAGCQSQMSAPPEQDI